ncbi:glycosyltransferase family 8 protein [Serpula lacrymans var. lacrymans S7.9]|uniref:Glycosyltransferase family 8 protein n=1 Tax=Serpula lacrymans var. lacrymans (strain S7.9) TaxID=578457 RepID=F8NLN9_SERL9|nr:glycosyltransferase family 8 protein [Serpula lacrymans var. lacrymans S7.9]EGO28220.1 glycosyltransferase family 8 protein [Serpula lacrymans var. lacrymans S7.9]
MERKAAYVTLLTKSSYLPGVLVLEFTLRAVGSRYPLVVMVTPQLPAEARAVLARKNITTTEVASLGPPEGVHTLSLSDVRFSDTWTKLRCFGLTEYHRVILLDADMLVLRRMDELMDLELEKDWIAATHVCACNPRRYPHYPADWIPANCAYTHLEHPIGLTSPSAITDSSPRPYSQLNSGLVVLNPSLHLFESIQRHLCTSPLVATWSFPDQDLLSDLFRGKWKPLPWCYNALKTLMLIHTPLWRDDEIRCLHYILPDKPWQKRVGVTDSGEYDKTHQWWWDNFELVEKEVRAMDEKGLEIILSNVASL